MQAFDVYFLGETLPDADPASVRQGVARLFKIQEDAAERLFSGKPLRVKQGLDVETASRYRAAFREVGALVQIVPAGGPPPTAGTAEPAASRAAPPEAVETQAPTPDQPLPTIGVDEEGITLAEPGAIIDPSPPAAIADIDISDLVALPPNSGSLADCTIEKPPQPIPDISHLKLVDD